MDIDIYLGIETYPSLIPRDNLCLPIAKCMTHPLGVPLSLLRFTTLLGVSLLCFRDLGKASPCATLGNLRTDQIILDLCVLASRLSPSVGSQSAEPAYAN